MPTKEYFKKLNGKYVKDEDARASIAEAQTELARPRIYSFDTIEAMKDSPLEAGDHAKTKGFYAANDGGAAYYEIAQNETADGSFVIALENGLFAKLIVENNSVNIRQLGAKSYDGNAKTDIKPYIEKYLSVLSDKKRLTLKIPYGLYHCSAIDFTQPFNIIGDDNFSLHNVKGTVISSMTEGQEYIFSVGNSESACRHFTLKNITFTSADYAVDSDTYTISSVKSIGTALKFVNACFGITDNLFFCDIKGSAMLITTSFEIYFNILNFRHVNAIETGVLVFPEAASGVISSPNISACSFDHLMFEATVGDCMVFEDGCKFFHSHIGVINYEDHSNSSSDYTQTTFTTDNIAEFNSSNPKHWAIFNIQGGSINGVDVDSIELNNFSKQYTTFNEENYALDRIINLQKVEDTSSKINVNLTIKSIMTVGLYKDSVVAYYHDDDTIYTLSQIFIKSFTHNSNEYGFIIDVDNFPFIECEGTLKKRWLTGYTPVLPNSASPAYKLLPPRSTRNFKLCYDQDALNSLKLCVKTGGDNKTEPAACFTLNSSTLKIRAKIESGATPTLSISGSRYATTQLTGTGDFKIYELNLHESSSTGDQVNIAHASDSSGENVIIDAIFN